MTGRWERHPPGRGGWSPAPVPHRVSARRRRSTGRARTPARAVSNGGERSARPGHGCGKKKPGQSPGEVNGQGRRGFRSIWLADRRSEPLAGCRRGSLLPFLACRSPLGYVPGCDGAGTDGTGPRSGRPFGEVDGVFSTPCQRSSRAEDGQVRIGSHGAEAGAGGALRRPRLEPTAARPHLSEGRIESALG